jgi:hypothetical protein
MFLLVMLVFLFTQVPDAPVPKPAQSPSSERHSSSEPFELQGDQLGESVETFLSQHPKAECDTSQKTRSACYQWANVSIFGLTASPGAGCTLKKRYAADCLQGITARFTDQRLVSLVYTVAGTDKSEVAAALRKKLGTPTMESRDGTVWNNGNASVSVVVGKAMEESSAPSLITISVSVAN